MFDALGISSLLLGGIGSLLGIGQNDAAAKAAEQTQQEETQLLNEARQQQVQENESNLLISQRNAQEQSLNPSLNKFTGSGTILTNPLGLLSATDTGASAPKNLLGT